MIGDCASSQLRTDEAFVDCGAGAWDAASLSHPRQITQILFFVGTIAELRNAPRSCVYGFPESHTSQVSIRRHIQHRRLRTLRDKYRSHRRCSYVQTDCHFANDDRIPGTTAGSISNTVLMPLCFSRQQAPLSRQHNKNLQ